MSHDKTTIVSRKIDSDGCDHICFHNNGECSEASCESVIIGKLCSQNRNLTPQQFETITS